MRRLLLTSLSVLTLTFMAWGQDYLTEVPHSQEKEGHHFPPFRIAVVIGHTYIPAIAGDAHFFIPSWGLDLEYWFNETWAIGLHNDVELQTFLVEHDHEMDLEREYPLVLTFDAIFKPWKGLVFQAGPGYELEKSHDFFLIRFGMEYEVEFGRHWDLSPMVFYDTRFEANDTWTIALGIGKRF